MEEIDLLGLIEQTDINESDVYTIIKKAGWTASKKYLVSKYFQNLNYNSLTRELSINEGTGVILPDFNIPRRYIAGFGFESNLGLTSFTIGAGVCFDSTNTELIELESSLLKNYLLPWSFGSNGNSNDGSVYVSGGTILSFIFVIKNVTTLEVDILTSQTSVPSLPTGYTVYRLIGSFLWTPNNNIHKLVSHKEFYLEFEKSNNYYKAIRGLHLPCNYANDYLFLYEMGTIFCENLEIRDFTNTINININNIAKSINLFAEGNLLGSFESTMTADIDYYIFAIAGEGKSEDLFVSSSEFPTLPAGFTYYATIGYGNCDALGVFRAWRRDYGWVDNDLSLASNSVVTGANPDIIPLNNTKTKIACFDGTATVEEISWTKEHCHDGVLNMGLQFHLHGYPTTANIGTVQFSIEVSIRNASGVVTNVAPYCQNIVATLTTSGVAWKQQSLYFNFVFDDMLAIGEQINVYMRRDPALDTYAFDFAVATFGFHYLSKKGGSNFITHN